MTTGELPYKKYFKIEHFLIEQKKTKRENLTTLKKIIVHSSLALRKNSVPKKLLINRNSANFLTHYVHNGFVRQ
jgi:hypothetical protein